MRASFHTFGCKLNQFETEALASAFRSRGFSLVDPSEEAEVYLINTCTVTGRSEQKARRFIRALARARPTALLVVTGCYAQLEAGALEGLAPNVAVVSQADKSLLLDLPRRLQEAGVITPKGGMSPKGPGVADAVLQNLRARPAGSVAQPFAFQVESYSFHSRAFLKIQDGCDHRCAYCRVPLARGASVSLEPELAARRVGLLEQAGYREVVLTGVNISAWRHGEQGLARLLERLLEATSTVRLRLSSLEPETIKPALVEVVRHPRLCPHFHLPVQSGSDRLLAAMRRRYSAEQVRRAASLLRDARGEPFLAADLITGFPGESEQDFRATFELAESLGFAKLHVFPFSPRPGTAAMRMRDRVPERVRDERVQALTGLSDRLARAYRRLWVGREVEVVLERRRAGGAAWRGFSGNYLPCAVRAVPEGPGGLSAGRLVRARIEDDSDPCGALYLGPAGA